MGDAKAENEKRFTLQVLGADEDYPRLIRGYGKACGGRFGIVLAPRQSSGILIHAVRENGVDRAHVWQPTNQNDVIAMPSVEQPFRDAVAWMKEVADGAPERGPVSYRGRWKALLICRGLSTPPELVLTRKVAAYASLAIHSHLGEHYRVTVTRDPRWFSQAFRNEDADERYTNLEAAIAGAYATLIGVVRTACGFRDTKRRAEIDADYAGKHPPKYAKEPASDPLARAEADAGKAKDPRIERVKAENKAKVGKVPTKPKAPIEGEPFGRGQRLLMSSANNDASIRGVVTYMGRKVGRGRYQGWHRLLSADGQTVHLRNDDQLPGLGLTIDERQVVTAASRAPEKALRGRVPLEGRSSSAMKGTNKGKRYWLYEVYEAGRLVGWDIIDSETTDPEKAGVGTVHVKDFSSTVSAKHEALKRLKNLNKRPTPKPPTQADVVAQARKSHSIGQPAPHPKYPEAPTSGIPQKPTKKAPKPAPPSGGALSEADKDAAMDKRMDDLLGKYLGAV